MQFFPVMCLSTMANMSGVRSACLIAGCLLGVLLVVFESVAASGGDWLAYGADAANTKYSALEQITAENVGDLGVAWTWDTVDADITEPGGLRWTSFQPTPLVVGGVLFTSTSLSQLVAVDGVTGETIWIFDPGAYRTGRPPNWGFVHRGPAYWRSGDVERLFLGTSDGRVISILPRTGERDLQFGIAGEVDLAALAPGLVTASQFGLTSPPIVCRGVLVVGSSISDIVRTKEMPRGQVQGLDPRTGKILWTFNLVPQGKEPGAETWEGESWRYSGNTNVWSLISVDDELGYVYLPTSTPTNDWYGGHRLGQNLFAESLLCLDAETGRRVWHFQFVHHGLWDYDVPAAPVLADIVVDGKRIKAVAQVTKQGFCYVFDRETGEPVWPIEERPVPASDVPGEASWPTQPVPTKPLAFERQGLSEDDLIDFTAALRAEALEIVKPYRIGPMFTPPSLKGTIQLPGSSGGANWGGAALDPESNILYVPSISSPSVVVLAAPDASRSNFRYARARPHRLEGPQGLPLIKPPYGRITAIDLNAGEIVWQVANGEGPREHPLLRDLKLPYLGQVGRAGPLLTKTLLFVADGNVATNSAGRDGGGTAFRAYDKTTGRVVWETQLPAHATGTPMTYMVDGKQFIVVAVMGDEVRGALVSYALP